MLQLPYQDEPLAGTSLSSLPRSATGLGYLSRVESPPLRWHCNNSSI